MPQAAIKKDVMSSRSGEAVRWRRPLLLLLMMWVVGMVGQGGAPVAAADWPGWLGPDRDGVSAETRWNPRWDARGPTILWQKQIGHGYATPVIAGERLFILGYDDAAGADVLYCLNPRSGQEIWTQQYPVAKHDKQHDGGPAGTVVVDGDRLYFVNREAVLRCVNVESGQGIWEQDLRQTHGARVPTWAFSTSPLILGETVIVDVGRTVALNKETGESIWVSPDYGAAYSSPQVFEHDGAPRLAIFPEHGLVILDARTGRELAQERWETRYGVNAVTPLVFDGDHIYISSGYNTGAGVFRFTGDGLESVWFSREMRNHMDNAVYRDGYIYGIDDAQRGSVRCLNARTGEVVWTQRDVGKGTLTLAGDVLIVQTENGDIWSAWATPEGFQPLSERVSVLDAQRCWIAPVLSHGLLYSRSSRGQLVCMDVSAEEELARLE